MEKRHLTMLLITIGIGFLSGCYLISLIATLPVTDPIYGQLLHFWKPWQGSITGGGVSEYLSKSQGPNLNDNATNASRNDINKKIQDASDAILPKDYYSLFLNLRQHLKDHPADLSLLRSYTQLKTPLSADQKKKVSLVFGLLAQCDKPEAWSIIKESIETSSDEFVVFQAISALNDYSLVPDDAFDTLLVVSRTHQSPYIHDYALLALGNLARKHPPFAERLVTMIIKQLADRHSTEQLKVALEVAGNHGDIRYLPYVQELASHPDELIRARAISATRAMEVEDINDWIVMRAIQEQSEFVKLEALKVLAERAKFYQISSPVTQIAIGAHSPQVFQAATQLLAQRMAIEGSIAQMGLIKIHDTMRNSAQDRKAILQIESYLSEASTQNP